MLTGLLATAAALLLVVLVAVFTAERAMPDRGTRWGAINTGEIEATIRAALGGDARDPQLLELARHHAFDRAARDFAGDTSPEGEGHAGRRARLAPTFVGTTREWNLAFARERGTREEEIAAAAVAALPPEIAETPGRVEVGAAVEQGRVAVTIVRGDRVATLDDPPILGVSGGLWGVRGVMAGEHPVTAIEARVVGTDVVVRSHRRGDPPDDPEAPRRFELELTLPAGDAPATVELVVDGAVVLVAPVRT